MSNPSDAAPIAERMFVLHVARVAMAGFVCAVAVARPAQFAEPAGVLVAGSSAYLGLTSCLEVLRTRLRRRWRSVMNLELLLDGVWLLAAITLSGGPASPLLILALPGIVAVTLLISYRTGLKVALWYSLLLFAGEAAREAGWVESSTGLERSATLPATVFVLCALGTAAFSSLNERELRTSRSSFRALADLGINLAESSSSTEVCASLASCMVDGLGFERAVVVTTSSEVTVGARCGAAGGELLSMARGLDVQRMLGGSVVHAAPHLIALADRSEPDAVDELLPAAGDIALVTMNIDSETSCAVIGKWRTGRGSRIGRPTVSAVTQAAAMTELALKNATLLDQVTWMAAHDALTHLPNRRALEDQLRRELARATRSDSRIGVVMIDVDHFKAVNDAHGHAVGDLVLQEVAARLDANLREGDFAARFGGEEFVVLITDLTPDDADALEVVDRLRSAAGGTIAGVAVTASAGLAIGPRDTDDADDLLAAADVALYAAKHAGRDRTVRFGSATSAKTHTRPS